MITRKHFLKIKNVKGIKNYGHDKSRGFDLVSIFHNGPKLEP